MNADVIKAVIQVIRENSVKNVSIFISLFLNNQSSFINLKDDACWNNPCEGCVPLGINSFNYTCTCGIKSLDSKCNTSIINDIKKKICVNKICLNLIIFTRIFK
jgi:hypothetical protein